MLTIKELKQIIESMRELSVDAEDFSWGPTYEMARERKEKALKLLRRELSFQEKISSL